MKPIIALIIVAIAILVIALKTNSDDPVSTPKPNQTSTNPTSENTAQPSPDTAAAPQRPTRSSQKREISERTKTAKWHPTEKGHLISPYNDETLPAIGVVTGSKMKDSDGNSFFVPPFEDSPFTIKPVAAPVPDRPGFAFNPWTQQAIDVRGIPPGTLIRDPSDLDPTHIISTPPSPEPRGIVTPNTQTDDGIPEIPNQRSSKETE